MSEGALRRRAVFNSTEAAIANYAAKPPWSLLHPDAVEAYVHGGFKAQPDGTIALRCRPQTEAAVFRQAGSSGAWGVLADVTLPVAVVAGRPGGTGPVAFAPAVVAALPNGTLIERPSLAHFGPLEDPAGMAADVAAWVESHP
jgi:pimeloyl-ACP methyl ester carboxylesterase